LVRLENLIKDIAKTELIYWQDSYSKTCQGSVLRIEPDKKRHLYLILDKTIFHPKSGGQPSDKGRIVGSDFEVEVKKAMLNNGVVVHWGKSKGGEPKVGEVTCEIDWNWRYLLMRRHTAGHLLDHCLASTTRKRVETTDSWLGDECYVGYKGEAPSNSALKEAEEKANRMIETGAPVKVSAVSYDTLIEHVPDAPNIFRLPRSSTYRIVEIEGCKPIPCGGTHTQNISEIGGLTVTSTQPSELGFRVYYEVTGSGTTSA
jgi:alanyl-tRNA synthetase